MVLIKEFVLFFFLSKWAVFFSKYDFFVRFFKIIFLPFLWRIVTGSFVLVDQFYFYIPHPPHKVWIFEKFIFELEAF